MKKRILTLSLVIALIATCFAGTLAYLQDTDAAKNTMTLGKVDIEQLEYERVVDENGNWVSTGEKDSYGFVPDKLQVFTQDKPMYPAVFTEGAIDWDDRVEGYMQSWGQVGASGNAKLFDDSVKNTVDKMVFVKNTGKNDVYVRTLVALEQGSVATDNFDKVIKTNSDYQHGTTAGHWDRETVAGNVKIGDSTYYIYCYTYRGPNSNPNGVLEVGKVSYPSLLQVYMLPEATNADVTAVDGNANGKYDILVLSQAVQTAGFDNATTALDTAFGDVTAATAAEWLANVQ